MSRTRKRDEKARSRMDVRARRDELEIAIALLSTMKRGENQSTRIMALANVNSRLCARWFRVFESQGLVTRAVLGKRVFFTLTNEGRRAIFRYRQFKKMLEAFRSPSPRISLTV